MERGSARLWRSINARYNLVGCECKNCKTSYFPPRLVCRNCGRKTNMVEKKFNGTGSVHSFTKIYVPPEDFIDEAPYTVVIVKLDDGPLVEGHLVDNEKSVKIGDKVKTVFRKMYAHGDEGLIHYHFKFEIV